VIVSPTNLTVETSQSATFTTTVSGTGKENFTYQWQHNEEDVDGETGDTLNLNNVTGKDKGSYQCIVKNQYGDGDVSSAVLNFSGESQNIASIILCVCLTTCHY